MLVGDIRFGERGGERFAVEVREPTRAWKAADIRECLDAIIGEQGEEVFERTGGVAEGPESAREHESLGSNRYGTTRPSAASFAPAYQQNASSETRPSTRQAKS